MRFCKLRIAWSIAWGILCLLVIVLWARSYRWFDEFAFLNSQGLMAVQTNEVGVLSLGWHDPDPRRAAQYYSRLFHTQQRGTRGISVPSKAGKFDSYFGPSQWYVASPCWFLAITSGAIGGLPWLKWRFNLRTLLIATTLVAVASVLITWTTR